MGIHTLNIDDEVWKHYKRKVDNMSREVQNFMLRELGEEEVKEKLDLIKSSDLTSKQKKLASGILENGERENSVNDITQFCRKRNIYERSDHIKSALKALSNLRLLPFSFENGSLIVKRLRCKCGAKNSALAIWKNDGVCFGCGRRIFDVGDDLGVEVID